MQYLSDYRRNEGYILEPDGFDRFKVFKKCVSSSARMASPTCSSATKIPISVPHFPVGPNWNEDIKLVVSSLWTRFMLHYESRDLSGRPTISFRQSTGRGLSIPLKEGWPTRLYLRALLHSPGIFLFTIRSAGSCFLVMSTAMYKDPHSS